MIQQVRKRTSIEDIIYSLHLYFLGLSLRNTSKAISRFVKRSHLLQLEIGYKSTNQKDYFISRPRYPHLSLMKNSTQKVGSEYVWLWVATIEFETKNILAIRISKERKICLSLMNDFYQIL